MNYQEFNNAVHRQISLLSQDRCIELAIKICKELFFDYRPFTEKFQWGNPGYIIDGINFCEKRSNDRIYLDQVKQLLQNIDSVTPDIDDYNGDELASYALNAASSVYETLEFLLDNDKLHIMNICIYYSDTTDFKIQKDKSLSKEQIDENPVMIKARQFLLDETK